MRICWIFVILFHSGPAQTLFQGKVVDEKNHSSIAFVSIGIPGKTIGTVSDENGYFALSLPAPFLTDSIKFQALGYHTKCVFISELKIDTLIEISLLAEPYKLEEVVVKPKHLKYKTLGVHKYSKTNCTGFSDAGGNWKGSEAAVLFHNGREIFLEYFAFYVIQNKYSDSLQFRLKFYHTTNSDWVGQPFVNTSIIFSVGPGSGERKVSLSEYAIRSASDFFISLECLEDEVDIRKFCYSGSLSTPSYYKVKAFSKWHSTRGTKQGGGGADFRVRVSYEK